MKKINYKKYGMIRDKSLDFSDDGNYFRCYRLGEMRVSVCTWNGEYFIAGHYDKAYELSYEVYSHFEHYKDLDLLNGIRGEEITEELLQKFVDGCKAFEAEVKEAF